MAIAHRVQDYLMWGGVNFDVVTHPHSMTSMETARLAHVPADCMAKSVILEDEDGFVMAVLPSSRHVRLGELSKEMKRKLRLATEDDLPNLFDDCEFGAVPALGPAYGMRTVIDDSLDTQSEIYFEAGDHEHLIHMSRTEFMDLMRDAGRAHFAYRM